MQNILRCVQWTQTTKRGPAHNAHRVPVEKQWEIIRVVQEGRDKVLTKMNTGTETSKEEKNNVWGREGKRKNKKSFPKNTEGWTWRDYGPVHI